jgi:hypothetical protein
LVAALQAEVDIHFQRFRKWRFPWKWKWKNKRNQELAISISGISIENGNV